MKNKEKRPNRPPIFSRKFSDWLKLNTTNARINNFKVGGGPSAMERPKSTPHLISYKGGNRIGRKRPKRYDTGRTVGDRKSGRDSDSLPIKMSKRSRPPGVSVGNGLPTLMRQANERRLPMKICPHCHSVLYDWEAEAEKLSVIGDSCDVTCDVCGNTVEVTLVSKEFSIR